MKLKYKRSSMEGEGIIPYSLQPTSGSTLELGKAVQFEIKPVMAGNSEKIHRIIKTVLVKPKYA